MNKHDLSTQRHSIAHLMAAAVGQLFDDVKFGVGPVIDTGAFYDFVLPRNLVPEDLEAINKRFQELLKRDLVFERKELSLEEALAFFESKNQPLKVELLQDLKKYGTSELDETAREFAMGKEAIITTYSIKDVTTGEIVFEDLCRGPHVESIAELRELGVQADRFSAAYWRGDQERNISMQRLYFLIYPTPAELKSYIETREEAAKRDHRVLGKELDLFFFNEFSPGNAFWLPKGLTIKNILLQYWREYHSTRGYKETATPLLAKQELWETSGHWAHYKDDMFLTKTKDGSTWSLKPMNCPGAMLCFGHKTRSYRELPLRFSDADTLHRDEIPGALHGLMRGRSFCQDDSHNFVTEAQIKDEAISILQIVKDFYGIFGVLDGVKLFLSTRPDDYMGDLETWNQAEADLRDILDASGFSYEIKEKDGAFYGPKIDIHLTDALNREWQCGTIQLDFQLPRNFDLKYNDENGELKTPVVIHRVIYGSLERFIGIIIEHFAGRLPYWIAPVQAKVLALNSSVEAYAAKVAEQLETVSLDAPVSHNALRFEVDYRTESLGRKIRDAEKEKIPVIIIVGPKDEAAGEVSIRTREGESKLPLTELTAFLKEYKG